MARCTIVGPLVTLLLVFDFVLFERKHDAPHEEDVTQHSAALAKSGLSLGIGISALVHFFGFGLLGELGFGIRDLFGLFLSA